MERRTIIYIVVIVVILAVVFFSQQPYARDIIKSLFSYIDKYAGAALTGGFREDKLSSDSSDSGLSAEASVEPSVEPSVGDTGYNSSSYNSLNTNAYATEEKDWSIFDFPKKLVEGVKSGGEALANNINNTAEKISENISTAKENITNYFTTVSNAIQGKENNSGNCQCPPIGK